MESIKETNVRQCNASNSTSVTACNTNCIPKYGILSIVVLCGWWSPHSLFNYHIQKGFINDIYAFNEKYIIYFENRKF